MRTKGRRPPVYGPKPAWKFWIYSTLNLVVQVRCGKRQDTILTNVVYATHGWHDTIGAVRSIVNVWWESWYVLQDVLMCNTIAHRSGIDRSIPDLPTDSGVVCQNVLKSMPTFPPDIYYRSNRTYCVVSTVCCVYHVCQNSVLSFTTSDLNY